MNSNELNQLRSNEKGVGNLSDENDIDATRYYHDEKPIDYTDVNGGKKSRRRRRRRRSTRGRGRRGGRRRHSTRRRRSTRR